MSVFSRVVDIRPGEGRLVARTFAVLFGVIAGHTVLETARDALFLGKLAASRLTFVYLALALIGLVVPSFNTRRVKQFGRRNAMVFTLMLAAFGTILWHFQPASRAVVYGIYIWSGLLGTVLVVQFWMLAGQLFTAAQGRRLFAGIASGGVLGAVSGGLVAVGALRVLPHDQGGGPDVRMLLLVAACFFLVSAYLLTGIAIPGDDAGPAPEGARTSILGGLGVLREHPYVARMALMIALSTATVLTTDYLFKYVAKANVAPQDLGLFFAQYYAVLNGAALLMQVFAGFFIVQRVGVGPALAVLPLLLLGGGVATALLGGTLLLVLLTKGADGALRHSLHRVVTELLFMPLPAEVRDRSKSLLDAVFVRGAQALTAGTILLLATLGLASVRLLAGLLAGLALAWLVSAVALRRPYMNLFRERLGHGAIDPGLLEVSELDLDAIEELMGALSSTEPERVIAAMNLMVDAGRARLIPALVLHHGSEAVVQRALEIVPDAHPEAWLSHVPDMLARGSVGVRASTIRALGRSQQLDLLRASLKDESLLVRAQAAFFVAQQEAPDQPLQHPAIAELLDDSALSYEERIDARRGLITALREGADVSWADVLLDLADSDVSDVVEGVAFAMARIGDERFVPILVRRLSARHGREAVREALVGLGEPAFDALESALCDPETAAQLRLHIPRSLARFGTERAARLLEGCLESEPDGAVRFKVLRGLGHLSSRFSVPIRSEPIERQLRRDLLKHLQLLALWIPLDEHDYRPGVRDVARLLTDLLADKIRQAAVRSFRLFQLLHPEEDARRIFIALQSADRRERANALEFMDALALEGDDEVRQLLRVVADDLPPREKVSRTEQLLGLRPHSAEAAIEYLLNEPELGLVALAAFVGLSFERGQLDDEVHDLLAAKPELAFVADTVVEMLELGGQHV